MSAAARKVSARMKRYGAERRKAAGEGEMRRGAERYFIGTLCFDYSEWVEDVFAGSLSPQRRSPIRHHRRQSFHRRITDHVHEKSLSVGGHVVVVATEAAISRCPNARFEQRPWRLNDKRCAAAVNRDAHEPIVAGREMADLICRRPTPTMATQMQPRTESVVWKNAVSAYGRMVSRLGIEPRTRRLRVCCSAS